MSYRDELQAAQARNAALETELAEARREIAELKGESTALVVADSATALALAGDDAPTRELILERTFEGTLDEVALGEIAELISDAGPTGANPSIQLVVNAGSVMWRGAWGAYPVNVRVSSRRNQVTVKVQVNVAPAGVGAGFVGAAAGGVSAGAVAGLASALALPAALPAVLALAPIIPVTWWVKRRLHRRWYRMQREKLERYFAKLVALVEKLIAESDTETGGEAGA